MVKLSRWARAGLSSLAGFGVVLLVVLGAAVPAHAALPDPVEPLPGMPGTYSRAIGTGGGQIFQDQIAYNLYMRQMLAARAAAGSTTVAPPPTAVPASKGVPITGIKPLAAGSAVTGAFMAGWMITDGTLAMYAANTGTNPLQGACGWGDFGISTVQVLYPMSAPDCSWTMTTPNAELGPVTELAAGSHGYYAKLLNFYTQSGQQTACFIATRAANFTPGTAMFANYKAANGTDTTWAVQMGSGWQGSCASLGSPSATHHIVASPPMTFQVKNTSTGAVVAASTTTTLDPDRKPSCQLTWPGGAVTTVVGTETFKETAGLPAAKYSALCNDGFVSKPGHGPNLLPTEIEIGSRRVDTNEYKPIQEAAPPEFTPDERKGLTPGTTTGGLVLERVVGTVITSCLGWLVNCANWWTATNQGTDTTVDQDYYRCRFNGQPVPLTECSPYRTTFDTQTSTPTITDPQTGVQTPWVTQPQAQTGTFPSTGVNPGYGTAVSTGGGGCTAGWSWNPVDWVVNPLRCVFIPSTAAVNGTIAGLGASAGSVSTVDPLMALVNELPTGSGCDGLPIDLTFFGYAFHGRLLEACSGPGQAAAAVVNGLLTLALITASVFAIGRYAAAVFGFVGPGGQMEHAQRVTEREMDRIARSGGGNRSE
jgi:hypothetical protein